MHTFNLVSAPLCRALNFMLQHYKIVSLPSLIHPVVSGLLYSVLVSQQCSVFELCLVKMLKVIAGNLKCNERFPNVFKQLINKQQWWNIASTQKNWWLIIMVYSPICLPTRLTNNSKRGDSIFSVSNRNHHSHDLTSNKVKYIPWQVTGIIVLCILCIRIKFKLILHFNTNSLMSSRFFTVNFNTKMKN